MQELDIPWQSLFVFGFVSQKKKVTRVRLGIWLEEKQYTEN